MEIYYIKYSDDPPEDGVWLENDTVFYDRKETAGRACDVVNADDLKRFNNQQQKAFEKWQTTELAFTALSSVENLDPQAIFPYHKREFQYGSYKPTYTVGIIKVED